MFRGVSSYSHHETVSKTGDEHVSNMHASFATTTHKEMLGDGYMAWSGWPSQDLAKARPRAREHEFVFPWLPAQWIPVVKAFPGAYVAHNSFRW